MTVVVVHLRGHLCDSLALLWVRLHAFFAEDGPVECVLGLFSLIFPAIEYKTIFTGYLHYVEEIGYVLSLSSLIDTSHGCIGYGISLYYFIHFHLKTSCGILMPKGNAFVVISS